VGTILARNRDGHKRPGIENDIHVGAWELRVAGVGIVSALHRTWPGLVAPGAGLQRQVNECSAAVQPDRALSTATGRGRVKWVLRLHAPSVH
jgi:hypothetical protein